MAWQEATMPSRPYLPDQTSSDLFFAPPAASRQPFLTCSGESHLGPPQHRGGGCSPASKSSGSLFPASAPGNPSN